MKICWDTLENIHLTKKGIFAKGSDSYVYRDKCSICGNPYLTIKCRPSDFCSKKCNDQYKLNLVYKKLKKGLENLGWKVIERKYTNIKQKVKYICDKGHKHSTTWDNFRTGKR